MDPQVERILDQIKELDAQQMQDLLALVSSYFSDSAEELTNMRADLIARHLMDASEVISRRSGN